MSRRSSRRVRSSASPVRSQPFSHSHKDDPRSDEPLAVATPVRGSRSHGIEQLESRTLFTTIGVPGAALDSGADSGVMEFQQGSPAITFRVAYNDVLAELIGVAVTSTDAILPAGDLVPASPTPPTVVPNLFKIYIAASDLSSYLVIAEVPSVTATGPRPMNPFGGGAGGLKIDNASTVGTAQVTIGTVGGSMLIGNVQKGTTVADVPIYQTAATGAIGVYPGSNGEPLEAGIEMAPTNDLDGTATPNDIGKIMIGGTILGSVDFPAAPAGTAALGASQGGNVGLFYAGEILTGDADGTFEEDGVPASSQTPNFVVGGDLRDFYTYGPIGGDIGAAAQIDNAQYLTGFDATVAGTVGDIYQNSGSLIGSFDVQHSASVYGLPESLYPESELEYLNKANEVGDVFQGLVSGTPQLPAPFTNDTPSTAQNLGSISDSNPNTGALLTDSSGNIQYSAYISGTLQASDPDPETDDDYAVPLLAGQTITVTLTGEGLVYARLLDPAGHVVETDESNVDASISLGLPFSYTADRPGQYVIDVRGLFTGGDYPYTLLVGGVGNMGLGTVRTATDIYDGGYDGAFEVDHGDLGALIAGSNIASGTAPTFSSDPASTPAPATTIDVANGNLRDLTAASIGIFNATSNTFGAGPYLLVPNGAVGLVSATDAGGVLDLMTNYDPALQYGANSYDPGSPVGGNFQDIDGAGTVYVDIATNQGIGDLIAGNMATADAASFIDVNQDNLGDDGTIDLIDVAGDLGSLDAGGPAIVTHAGGNVRYMVVGGAVYQDHFFSSGGGSLTQYSDGQAVTLTDDSGSSMVYTPTGATTTATVTNADGTTTTTTTGPQLTFQTYGIRDKGGVVVISVTSTGGLTVTSNGALGSNSQAEVGTITVNGDAPAVALATNASAADVTDANGEDTYADTTNTAETTTDANGNSINDPLFTVTLNGTASTDVFNILVNNPGLTDTGNINSIEDLTPGGEIGGISAGSVGTILSYGTIGLMKSDTGAAVLPLPTPQIALLPTSGLGVDYGFADQTNGIVTFGNVYAIEAYEGLGNIRVAGSIQQVTANSNGKLSGTGFEGIDAPIVDVDDGATDSGRILNVSIGQGILPSGSGNVAFSGIFAQGDIGTVTNGNVAESDIRGDIISTSTIDNIALGNGSVIGSTVGVFTTFDMASPIGPARLLPQTNFSLTAPVYAIRNVSVSGRGGIIGTLFIASSMDTITVSSKGFGILYSAFSTVGDSVINSITAGGYGVRDCAITSGASLNTLSATGNGSQLSVATFGTDVRESESVGIDPYFGTEPSALTDLDAALGTSATTPIIADVTDTGVLEDDVVQGQASLGSVSAQTIRTAEALITQTSPLNPTIPVLGVTFPMSLNFAASTGSIIVRGIIDGLQVTTGSLGRFKPSGSVSRCGIAVSGAINTLTIHGNFGQTFTSPFSGLTTPDSYIDALGVNGTIGTLRIYGSLNGDVTANAHIGSIIITGNVVGSIDINGQTNGLALGSIRIGGTLSNGSLVIDGSAGSIITNGSLGSLGGSLTVTGSLKSLSVGQNHGLHGSDLALNLNVQEGLGSLTVYGRIDGDVTIAGDLGKLRVTNDGSTTNVISGAFNVGGKLGTAKLIGGNLNADITVNGNIASLSIYNGSVLAGDTITSRIGTLGKFTLIGGTGAGVFGSIDTPNGVDEIIDIGGNFGDGTDAASILAYSISKLLIRGSVSGDTSIATTAALASLEIDGDVAAGAAIVGHPIGKQKIGGSNLGIVTAS